MKFQNTAILSLGSNLGNRMQNLQQGIDYINANVATVIKISGIYENPAMGFAGDAFYNCTLLVHTFNNVQALLKGLQQAEEEGGRVRSADGAHISRTIDIDIISFNNDVINEPYLQVPHPRMQLRNFVLYPLRDIAPNWAHPVLKQDVNSLIDRAEDKSPCEFVMQLPAPLTVFNPEHFNYIAIEGNIGAGKTSLAGKIAEDFNARLVLERFADNPFLPKFYADPSRYAFSLEMSFLADRYQQITDDLAQFNPDSDFVVADYHVFKSLIFAKVTLNQDEYSLYHKLFDIMYSEIPKPGLYVYLYQNSETLLQQIKRRGRSYEQDITADYLEDIHNGYLDYIQSATGNILQINITGRDFVHNQQDYIWLLGQIQNAVKL